jgi:hypothetical protein
MALKSMSVVFGLALLFTLVAAAALRRTMRSENAYVPGTCTVASLELREYKGRNYTSHYGWVQLEHVVGGATYGGQVDTRDQPSGGSWSDGPTAQRELTARYPVGRGVPCFYDPASPGEITLARGVGGGGTMMVLAVVFDVIFGGCFALTLRAYRRWKRGVGT